MIYLLDVSALIAFGLREHALHARVATWVRTFENRDEVRFASCAIIELGFLRILTQAPSYSFTIAQGKMLLSQLKMTKGLRFSFLPDNQGADDLPLWVKGPKQITDGHLLELAKAHGAEMATLDERIPGALLIPGKR
jgi:predicted nucleic acid-binding protein